MDVEIWAAADDYATYINVSQPSQGIVQEKPLFTNIDGGIGLFFSRAVRIQENAVEHVFHGQLVARHLYLRYGLGRFSWDRSCICVDGDKVCF